MLIKTILTFLGLIPFTFLIALTIEIIKPLHLILGKFLEVLDMFGLWLLEIIDKFFD